MIQNTGNTGNKRFNVMQDVATEMVPSLVDELLKNEISDEEGSTAESEQQTPTLTQIAPVHPQAAKQTPSANAIKPVTKKPVAKAAEADQKKKEDRKKSVAPTQEEERAAMLKKLQIFVGRWDLDKKKSDLLDDIFAYLKISYLKRKAFNQFVIQNIISLDAENYHVVVHSRMPLGIEKRILSNLDGEEREVADEDVGAWHVKTTVEGNVIRFEKRCADCKVIETREVMGCGNTQLFTVRLIKNNGEELVANRWLNKVHD
eukprot:Platyproteum_vivax@DN4708_c0_g1_i2.p1